MAIAQSTAAVPLTLHNIAAVDRMPMQHPMCRCDCVVHNAQFSHTTSPRLAANSDDEVASAYTKPLTRSDSSHSLQSLSAQSNTTDAVSCGCSSSCNITIRPFLGKTIVLLRTSSTARAPVYASLRRMGLHIIMVHPFANTASFPSECIDEWIEMDTSDVDKLYETLTSAPYAGRFDAIASFDEYGVFPAAQLNARLGKKSLPMTPAGISTTNIKSRFRHWCVRHKVAAPRFASLPTRGADPVETVAAAGLLYPLVAKPSPGAGCNLEQLTDNEAQLLVCTARLWNAIDAMRPTAAHFEALGEKIHILLEEFIEGPEVDVDAIVEDGVVRFAGVSDNFPTVRPYFSEVGGLAPSALPKTHQDDLVSLLEQFVAAMAVDGEKVTGVLHFEAKYDVRRDQAVTIEVNCRMGSAETHTMVTTGFGVDLAEAAMRLALGMPLQPLPAHVPGLAACGTGRYAASANLYPQKAGKLVEILPPPAQLSLLAAMPFPMARGAPVLLPPDSFGCLLWLVAEGPTPDEAIRRMQAMCKQCSIVVEEAQQ